MADLEELKKSSTDQIEELSEKEILEYDKKSDQMTEILYNAWLAKINKNKL